MKRTDSDMGHLQRENLNYITVT